MHFMITLWETVIYEPLYNALLFITNSLPGANIGFGVIALTILVRIILLPISKKGLLSQYKMRLIEPKIKAIREKKLSKELEAQETFALYKQEGVNPFSGCLYLIIQLPILLALYSVFTKGVIQSEHIYSFIQTDGLNTLFLGFIEITERFIPFAILAGVTQGIQAFLMPKPTISTDGENTFQNQLAKSMSVQTRYVLPIIIIFIASNLSAAVSLYWIVANVFSIGQELYFRKKFDALYK